MLLKILLLVFAGVWMAGIVVYLGHQMIKFLDEVMSDLEESETKGDNNE
nr:hypothetical protein [uncultured Ruminococcus sp.]